MDAKLLVTPEQLSQTASAFGTSATQVKALHDSMIQKVNNLSNVWIGAAADTYRSKFSALQKSMDKINQMITEHVTDLNSMADEYSAAETAATSLADELPVSDL